MTIAKMGEVSDAAATARFATAAEPNVSVIVGSFRRWFLLPTIFISCTMKDSDISWNFCLLFYFFIFS